MSFGTNTSGYREHEMRRQSPMLIGVSLSQKTAISEIKHLAMAKQGNSIPFRGLQERQSPCFLFSFQNLSSASSMLSACSSRSSFSSPENNQSPRRPLLEWWGARLWMGTRSSCWPRAGGERALALSLFLPGSAYDRVDHMPFERARLPANARMPRP